MVVLMIVLYNFLNTVLYFNLEIVYAISEVLCIKLFLRQLRVGLENRDGVRCLLELQTFQ